MFEGAVSSHAGASDRQWQTRSHSTESAAERFGSGESSRDGPLDPAGHLGRGSRATPFVRGRRREREEQQTARGIAVAADRTS